MKIRLPHRAGARYNPGMTRKHLTALALCAACALAPRHAARAEDGEKSPAPPAQPAKEDEKVPAPPTGTEGPKAPQDPKIAALVKEMEAPEDAAKRAKAFDALLALGEPGVAAVRESLSCRGAKIVIESTVTPPAAPPDTPIKVEFRLKNTGTGTVWIRASCTDEYLMQFQERGRFEGLGRTRPTVETPIDHEYPDYGNKDLPGDHRLNFWRPVRPGGTIARAEVNTKIPRVGCLAVIGRSAINVPDPKRENGFELQGEFGKPDFLVATALMREAVQDRQYVEAYALPDLEHLPAEGPAAFEVAPEFEELPATTSHFLCTVTVRNTKPATPLLFELGMARYAWVALLDERGVPVAPSSFSDCQRTGSPDSSKYLPDPVKDSASLKLLIPRPAKPGTYRILAGYEVTPGGARPGDDRPPNFTDALDEDIPHERLTQARVFALSKPIRVPGAFRSDLPPPLPGEPPDELFKEPIDRRFVDATWHDELKSVSLMHPRTGERPNYFPSSFLSDMRPALLHARCLADADITKILIYFHCGEALIAQARASKRPFDCAYAEFAIDKAAELSDAQLPARHALRTGSHLAQAEICFLKGQYAEARAKLAVVREVFEPQQDVLPWDRVRYLSLYMRTYTATGAASEAFEVYRDNRFWVQAEFGPDSKAESLLAADALAAATALKDTAGIRDLTDKLEAFDKAKGKFDDSHFKNFFRLIEQGGSLKKRGKLDDAEMVLRSAYFFACGVKQLEFPEKMAAEELSGTYRAAKKWDKYLQYQLRNLAYEERNPDYDAKSLSEALCNAGAGLTLLGKLDQARSYLIRAREMAGKVDNPEKVIPGTIKYIQNWFEKHP